MVTGLIIISILGLLGIIYTLLSINFAEVDEQGIEEEFNKNDFSKPIGWKVGKLPPEMEPKNKVEKPEIKVEKKRMSVENYFTTLQEKNDSPLLKKNYLVNQNKF